MRRFVIGITGGIATGKTSVLNALARRGVPVISSDAIAHECLRPGHPAYRRIVHRFGRRILRSKGRICRTHLGAIVFSDPPQRKWLEAQIHPWVVRRLKAFIRKHSGLTALDIPLLFEARLEKLVDASVVVWSSQKQQLQRLRHRNGLSRPAALQRLRAQMPLSEKKERADYLIANNRGPAALRQAVARLLARIVRDKKGLTWGKSHV